MEYISALALVVSLASVWYARRSARAAGRSMELGRLNALLSLRSHYHERMQVIGQLAQDLRNTQGGRQAEEDLAEMDTRLREVTKAIWQVHGRVIDI